MKVIQLINGMTTGGAESLVKEYVIHSPEGMEQTVVLTNLFTGSSNETAIRNAGVRLISIPERLGWGGPRRSLPVRAIRCLLERKLFIQEFKKILQEEKPDCIHAHLGVLPFLAGCIKELKHVRIVYTCHTEVSVMFRPERKDLIRAARKLIRHCDMQIIALHERMAQELNVFFGEGTSFPVNNCIDCQRFREPGIDRTAFRQSLEIPADAYVVGHVGRFDEEKNHIFLAEVFQELCNREKNAYLLMIGSGPLRQEIQERLASYGLQDRVCMLENRSDIPQLMHIMDVFVFPSLFEGFPIVLLEAQAAGLRCLIADHITEKILLTEQIFPLSLDRGAAYWCDILLSNQGTPPGSHEKLEQYDIHTVLKQLKEVYEATNT